LPTADPIISPARRCFSGTVATSVPRLRVTRYTNARASGGAQSRGPISRTFSRVLPLARIRQRSSEYRSVNTVSSLLATPGVAGATARTRALRSS